MSNVKSREIVATYTERGRTFEVERITWRNSAGLSFDITDTATALCLTPESLDRQPTATDVEDILDRLRADMRENCIDPFYAGQREVLEIVTDGC